MFFDIDERNELHDHMTRSVCLALGVIQWGCLIEGLPLGNHRVWVPSPQSREWLPATSGARASISLPNPKIVLSSRETRGLHVLEKKRDQESKAEPVMAAELMPGCRHDDRLCRRGGELDSIKHADQRLHK